MFMFQFWLQSQFSEATFWKLSLLDLHRFIQRGIYFNCVHLLQSKFILLSCYAYETNLNRLGWFMQPKCTYKNRNSLKYTACRPDLQIGGHFMIFNSIEKTQHKCCYISLGKLYVRIINMIFLSLQNTKMGLWRIRNCMQINRKYSGQ